MNTRVLPKPKEMIVMVLYDGLIENVYEYVDAIPFENLLLMFDKQYGISLFVRLEKKMCSENVFVYFFTDDVSRKEYAITIRNKFPHIECLLEELTIKNFTKNLN